MENTKPMNTLELLLETDVSKFKARATKKMEIKRLSEIVGQPFIVTATALTNSQTHHISEISSDQNSDMKIQVVIEACRIDGKKLNNGELLKKFECTTPIELLNQLFLPGEVYELYSTVNELSGYGVDRVTEIKN